MKLLIPILTAFLLSSCTTGFWIFDQIDGGDGDTPTTVPDGPADSSIGIRNLIAVDDNGETLGQILSAGGAVLTLYNENGYIYSIFWSGDPVKTNTYYTDGSCGSSPYFLPSDQPYSYKYVHIDGNGTFYTPANTASGVAITTSISVGSRLDSFGTCSVWGGSGNYIEMSSVSRSALGIPSTIQSPLTVTED